MKKQFFVIPTQHLDVAWLWKRSPEGEELMRICFEWAVNMIEADPERKFVFSRSTPWSFDVVEKKYPELFQAVRKYVASGNIECTGGQWVEPDNVLPSGESHIRQNLYGQRYYRSRFGKQAKVVWDPDVFAHGNTLPQIFRETGMVAYYSHRSLPRDSAGNPVRQFRWKAPDGSEVFVFGGNWTKLPSREQIYTALESGSPVEFAATGLFSDRRITMNTGWIRSIEELNEAVRDADVRWAGAEEMVPVMDSYKDTLPVITGDLGGYQFTGTYTTDGHIKKWNRTLESRLADIEYLQVMCFVNGYEYYPGEMEAVWKDFLVNQFHDILCGTSYRPVHEEAYELYRGIDETLRNLEIRMVTSLSRCAVNVTSGIIAVWNAGLSGERLPVMVPVHMEQAAVAGEGRLLESQVFRFSDGELRLLFYPENRIGMSCMQEFYLKYREQEGPENQEPVSPESELDRSTFVLENRYIRAVVDPGTGEITSLKEKTTGREILKAGQPGNRIRFYEDRFPDRSPLPEHTWESWMISYTGKEYGPAEVKGVHVTSEGKLGKCITVEREISLPGGNRSTRIFQDIYLVEDCPLLFFRTSGEWYACGVTAKAEFSFSFSADRVTAEMPYGVIEREADYGWSREKTEKSSEDRNVWGKGTQEPDRPMQRWIDFAADGDGGRAPFGVALLNDGKYGYDSGKDFFRLSLMRSPEMRPGEVNGLGPFSFTYAVYPHPLSWSEARVPEYAAWLNRGFLVTSWSHSAELPVSRLFSLTGEGLSPGALKVAEDGDGIVIRLFEHRGTSARCGINFHIPVTSCVRCNALEDPHPEKKGISKTGENSFFLEVNPWEILTLKVYTG